MTIAEFIYTVLLKPRPLRVTANTIIRALLPRTVKYGPAKVVLNPRDPVVSGALTFRVYEHREIAFFRSVLRPGMTLLDIGANVGLYSAIGSHAVGREGKVLAFEPDPDNFRYLEATVRENECGNVALFPLAAARQEGVARLYTSSSNRGDNRLYDNELRDGSIEIRTVRLDNFLPTAGVSRVDFIKIDVQGFEGHVLAGLEEVIRNSPRIVVMSEFWPSGLTQAGTDPRHFLQMLEEFGLVLHELLSRGRTLLISNKGGLIRRYPGRRYTNVVGYGPEHEV